MDAEYSSHAASLGLPSLFRGIYNRVARRLGVDPSYVSRVARGQRRSHAIQAALNIEMKKILDTARASKDRLLSLNGTPVAAHREKRRTPKSGSVAPAI